ncbi:hypothetical protein, partial [Rikenella microfusus]|uniref:hypothetical protein n=1 Tax=Rikenella microfusus TaxID=28139 RepID=UPI003A92ABC2
SPDGVGRRSENDYLCGPKLPERREIERRSSFIRSSFPNGKGDYRNTRHTIEAGLERRLPSAYRFPGIGTHLSFQPISKKLNKEDSL